GSCPREPSHSRGVSEMSKQERVLTRAYSRAAVRPRGVRLRRLASRRTDFRSLKFTDTEGHDMNRKGLFALVAVTGVALAIAGTAVAAGASSSDKDIQRAIKDASSGRAKNIIYLIGDGMGVQEI